jgi:hypothetical protein
MLLLFVLEQYISIMVQTFQQGRTELHPASFNGFFFVAVIPTPCRNQLNVLSLRIHQYDQSRNTPACFYVRL